MFNYINFIRVQLKSTTKFVIGYQLCQISIPTYSKRLEIQMHCNLMMIVDGENETADSNAEFRLVASSFFPDVQMKY